MAGAIGASSTSATALNYAQAASIGGGILGGLLDFPIQKSFNVKQTRHAREFTEYMSNTQYQRAVADLKAAGLNPLLAYTQGGAGGASYSPASVPSSDFGGVAGDLGNALASAQQMKLVNETIRRARLDNELAEKDVKAFDQRLEAELNKIYTEIDAIGTQASSSAQDVFNKRKTGEILDAEVKSAQVLEKLRGTKAGEVALIVREFLRSIGK